MKKGVFSTLLKGSAVGGSMMVPGVSGGSMAMILGVYDKLISSVSNIFKKPKESILFLLIFVGGALGGMIIFSKPLSFLMERFPYPVAYFFIGAVAGSIPMIFKKAQIEKFKPSIILWLALGIATVLLIGFIPSDMLSQTTGFAGILIQLFAGILVSIGLVLPGISVMQMLAMLGLYQILLTSLSTLDFGALLGFWPLIIGCVGGIFALTGIMDKAMEKFPYQSYLIILGFVIGSVNELRVELVPSFPSGINILLCAVTAVLGFTAVYFISKKEE